MKKLKFSILFFILFTAKSFGQTNKYLVLKTNDTIFGKRLIFREKEIGVKVGKTKKMYDKNLLLGYYDNINPFNYSYFEKVPSPHSWSNIGDEAFIQRIIDGRIKVYIVPTQNSSNLYISKDNSKLILIPTGQLKFRKKKTYEILRKYIEDDTEILNQMRTIGNKRIEFENLIENYNNNFKKLIEKK